MAEGAWELRVRDRNREQVAAIDSYQAATFVQHFNGVGAWSLKGIPMGSQAALGLVAGAGIIAVRDGEIIMAGPVLWPTVNWSEDGFMLDVSGASDDLALWGRLAYPDAPSINPNGAYGDTRTGVAETVMHAYVANNAGPLANSTRRWAGLSMDADTGLGSAVAYTARFDVLGDVLTQLALVDGLGFRVRQDEDSASLLFQVWMPADESGTARFAPELGNVREYAYSQKVAALNHVVVGGGGEGTLRTFVELDNATSQALWGMRLEGFKDQRQTTDVTELTQAGQEELDTRGDQVNLRLEPVDTTAVTYGASYRVGDTVGVLIDGVLITDVVRTIQFELASDGEVITPTVGTPGSIEAGTSEEHAVDLLLERTQALSRRLSRLSTAT